MTYVGVFNYPLSIRQLSFSDNGKHYKEQNTLPLLEQEKQSGKEM